MTLDEYKSVINAYLDFYPDDRIDVKIVSSTLRQALDDEAEGRTVDDDVKTTISYMNRSYTAVTITVYYPELTLTNDSGRTHTVYGIYTCIHYPSMTFTMGRTDYTLAEMQAGYRHSHITKGDFSSMGTFCTGSDDTPFNKIRTRFLGHHYSDFDLLIQSLIIETERMIRIESNAGIPYISFMDVGRNSSSTPLSVPYRAGNFTTSTFSAVTLRDFIPYYCSLGLDDFYYDGRNWQLKATDAEFITRVTKVAKAFTKTRRNPEIFSPAYLKGGLYYNAVEHGSYSFTAGQHVTWSFKGHRPVLRIIGDSDDTPIQDVFILRMDIISSVYTFLLYLINAFYANIGKHRDSACSRAYKIKSRLIREL